MTEGQELALLIVGTLAGLGYLVGALWRGFAVSEGLRDRGATERAVVLGSILAGAFVFTRVFHGLAFVCGAFADLYRVFHPKQTLPGARVVKR